MMKKHKVPGRQSTPSKPRESSIEQSPNEPQTKVLLSVIKENNVLPAFEINTNRSSLLSPNTQQPSRARSKTVQNKADPTTITVNPILKQLNNHDQILEQSSVDISVIKPPLSKKKQSNNVLVDNLENSTINNTQFLQSGRKQVPNTSQGHKKNGAKTGVTSQQLLTTKPPVGRPKDSTTKKVANFDDYVSQSVTPAKKTKITKALEQEYTRSPSRSAVKIQQLYTPAHASNQFTDDNTKTLLKSKTGLNTQATMSRMNTNLQQSKIIANSYIGAAAASAKAADYVFGSCPYCLKNRCYVIDLECGHAFCSSCCLNLIKITKIKKGLKMTNYKEISKKQGTMRACEICNLPRIIKPQNQIAMHHPAICVWLTPTSHPIQPLKTESLMCEEHKEKYKLYCFTEDKPLCLSCTTDNNNARHSTHYVKSLKQIIEQANNEKDRLQEEIKEQMDRVDSAIQYFNGVEGIFMTQKDLYLKKLSADFEVIYKLLERKHAELKDKITSLYDCSLKEAYQYVEGLQSIKDTFESIRTVEIKQDMEQVNLNKQILFRIRDIETELDFELQGQDMDLIESKFVYEPFQKIESILMKYDFMPVQQTQLNNLESVFTKASPNSEVTRTSKIITKDLICADFLLIMPPKMIKAELIYSYTQEQAAILSESNLAQQQEGGTAALGSLTSQILNPSSLNHPQRFHARCDNKGPTLLFVKANEGHIFGGFNPTSWVSEFMYSECTDSYLFSITDGKGRKPIKCPVKQDKADKAIKQNEANYSPAFGEANISDLFIAFKKLENSYSVVGNVYKLPKGQKGDTFLAGKHNDWKIDDIEVWAVTF